MKKKVLCICAKGMNRSKYLAEYLRRKGYSTRYGGIDPENEKRYKLLKEKDVEWAEIVIIVRKRLLKIFKKKYPKFKGKLIVLDVTDSRRLIGEKYPEFKEINYEQFQKKWTRPQLRKEIKKYLKTK